MAEGVRAHDLMLRHFERVHSNLRLAQAMTMLVRLQFDEVQPNVLVVIRDDGSFEGLLTARLLCRSLLALWKPARSVREDESRLLQQLVEVVTDRAELEVHDALMRGLPTVGVDDGLVSMIDAVCEHQLEFLPVVASDQVVGLVPITRLLEATAELVLRPEDEGVQF